MIRRKVTKTFHRTGLAIGAFSMIMAGIHISANADTTTTTPSYPVPQPPAVMAGSAVLMNAASGQILYAKDADERRAPASTTKLMTMYLLEKAIHDHQVTWNEQVPVTPDAYQIATEPGVSDAYLDPREHFTVEDMMKFIAVISANDATVAVADKLAGDKQAFVDEMNQEAKHLGLTNTHYMNPDGLPVPNHYMSAMDLAKLARDLVTTYPEVLKYTAMPKVTVRKGQTWPGTDKLLGQYQGLDGLKTGFTNDAGYCFVGTAEQNGVRLITVVMADTKTDENQRFRDAAKLLDYGFHDFTQTIVAPKGKVLTQTVSVPNGAQTKLQVAPVEDVVADLPSNVKGTVEIKADKLSVPIKKGQTVGTVEYVVNGQPVVSEPLVAAVDDNKAGFLTRMFRGIGRWISHLFHHL